MGLVGKQLVGTGIDAHSIWCQQNVAHMHVSIAGPTLCSSRHPMSVGLPVSRLKRVSYPPVLRLSRNSARILMIQGFGFPHSWYRAYWLSKGKPAMKRTELEQLLCLWHISSAPAG